MVKDKIILVTGASRGIGRATAMLLAEHGARIIANYNESKKEADSLVADLSGKGLEATTIKADVANEQEVKAMFAEIKQYGGLDVLVNNAGVVSNNLLLMTSMQEYLRVVETNNKGAFLCMQQAAKMMRKKNRGKIINLSSIVGRNGNSGQVAYAGSKAFIIGMTQSAARELGPFGITVNAVAPGLIDTDMTRDLREEFKQRLLSNVSLGRIGTPLDVARVILFLSSDLSDYVSGQVIGVDGCQIM
ncbi:MAG: 3-oxoacyl-ACP reductase family protein [bacterium]